MNAHLIPFARKAETFSLAVGVSCHTHGVDTFDARLRHVLRATIIALRPMGFEAIVRPFYDSAFDAYAATEEKKRKKTHIIGEVRGATIVL